MDGARTAAEGFRAAFGQDPAGVWSAPGRVNLIGEHTDYNDGFVLPIAIDRRTWVAVGARPDRVARVGSALADAVVEHPVDTISPDAVHGWSAYPFGAAWGVLDVVGDRSAGAGFDAHVVSDVPLGAGLSSSAALTCSLATALSDVWGLGLTGEQLLRATHRAENVVVGAPTGILDQAAALFCEEGQALLVDCRTRERAPAPLDLAGSGLSLLVVDTGIAHAHADGGYADRRRACEEAAARLGVPALRDVGVEELAAGRALLDETTYRRARHVVTEDARVLETVERLGGGGPGSVGDLMLASHASMRDDFEISVPELDLAVESATAAGALGARMTGGGFGGSAIALVEQARVAAVTTAVTESFARHGHAAPQVFAVSPSPGARRDR